MQKLDAGVGIGTLVGANAPTPPYGGGLAPPTPPLWWGLAPPHPLKVGLWAALMAINDRDSFARKYRDSLARKYRNWFVDW